jgi:acyl-CoA synthetase (AMP-forming)/AMP-acid ligase II
VLTAQVVGAPDPDWGEAVVAFVELRAGAALDSTKMKATLRQSLAPFKTPKVYIQVEAGGWPLTGNGKILRSELEAWAAARSGEGGRRSAAQLAAFDKRSGVATSLPRDAGRS